MVGVWLPVGEAWPPMGGESPVQGNCRWSTLVYLIIFMTLTTSACYRTFPEKRQCKHTNLLISAADKSLTVQQTKRSFFFQKEVITSFPKLHQFPETLSCSQMELASSQLAILLQTALTKADSNYMPIQQQKPATSIIT